MSTLRPKTLRAVSLATAAVMFFGAMLVQAPLRSMSKEYELVPSGDAALARHPELQLLSVAPGGLKSLIVSYLWMRSQSLHREGRHFDAKQLAELICKLQPRFSSVWEFLSWQMAWNISATVHTDQEKWHWVRAGIVLLRDQGIAMNPNALMLYKQLSWTFTSKMGDETDDSHRYYKQKWAQTMQRLLGTPTLYDKDQTLANFKKIADAPLNKHADTRGPDIQKDMREQLIRENPDVAALNSDLRKKAGLEIDAQLLEAYNFCTTDETVGITQTESMKNRDSRLRQQAKALKDPAERDSQLSKLDRRAKWSEVINDPNHRQGLDKALAFVRAQMLWGVHKMDPDYMYKMMQELGPIDWRLVWSHGLYWSRYGSDHCKDVPKETIDALNTDRTLLTCLKTITWQGKLYYRAARDTLTNREGVPQIRLQSDWRFIEATHQEYIRLGTIHADIRGESFAENALGEGHVNFLINAIGSLYIRGKTDKAKEYFQWVRDNYDKKDDELWNSKTVREFVARNLSEEGSLIRRVALAQITAAVQIAMGGLASGDQETFRKNMDYAKRLRSKYNTENAQNSQRAPLRPLSMFSADTLIELLLRPKLWGFDLTLKQKSMIFAAVEQAYPSVTAVVYDHIEDSLMRMCEDEKRDFNTVFPPPRDLDAYRRWKEAQLQQRQ